MKNMTEKELLSFRFEKKKVGSYTFYEYEHEDTPYRINFNKLPTYQEFFEEIKKTGIEIGRKQIKEEISTAQWTLKNLGIDR
jgi:hypothetical protein